MAKLIWITRDEWLALPKPACPDQEPKDISFTLPLDEIRGRIVSHDPRQKMMRIFPGQLNGGMDHLTGEDSRLLTITTRP
ncbi:MAG: hypothetical protein P1U90_18765 [Akkermansiaceae bacterium]|nr:hypothetical protein [Akkermansiaceae bacterium]